MSIVTVRCHELAHLRLYNRIAIMAIAFFDGDADGISIADEAIVQI